MCSALEVWQHFEVLRGTLGWNRNKQAAALLAFPPAGKGAQTAPVLPSLPLGWRSHERSLTLPHGLASGHLNSLGDRSNFYHEVTSNSSSSGITRPVRTTRAAKQFSMGCHQGKCNDMPQSGSCSRVQFAAAWWALVGIH